MTDDLGAEQVLEAQVATTLCQCNRVIRSMPSAEEIALMLKLARSVIKTVRASSATTPAGSIQQAQELWLAAGALVHDNDNSFFDKKPPMVVRKWLAKTNSQPVPRDIVARIYKAHLDASWKWANQLVPHSPAPAPAPLKKH